MAWLASVANAITGISVVAKKVLDRLWGDQTSKDARTERAGEQALERAKVAQSADELNAADAELQRVYEQARSSHKPD